MGSKYENPNLDFVRFCEFLRVFKRFENQV